MLSIKALLLVLTIYPAKQSLQNCKMILAPSAALLSFYCLVAFLDFMNIKQTRERVGRGRVNPPTTLSKTMPIAKGPNCDHISNNL